MSDWSADAARDLMSLGGRLALLTRGEGSWVWDADENRYLDFLGGIAVNCLGHAHPVFVDAVSRQAATLSHVSNYFASPAQLEIAARLKRLAGTGEQGRVYLATPAPRRMRPRSSWRACTAPGSSRPRGAHARRSSSSRGPSTGAPWEPCR